MRAFAEEVIRQAAVAAGFPSERVVRRPERANKLAPMPRLEIEIRSESLNRSFRRISKQDSLSHPGTHRTVRSRIYERILDIRAELFCADEEELAAAVVAFLLNLPARAADAENNLVRIEANRAERGGFETRVVEVFKARSAAIHLRFTGMICTDRELPLIRDINLKDGVSPT